MNDFDERMRPLPDFGADRRWVVGRRWLAEQGLSRAQIRGMLDGARWVRSGSRSVQLHNGPLDLSGRWMRAVTETGPQAALGGLTALTAAGLEGLSDTAIHVWTPKSTRPGHAPGVVVHESRRWDRDDVDDDGIRRMKPAVAALQAALWARTDREAVLLVCMPVQQRLVRTADLAEHLERIRRSSRRLLLRRTLLDLTDGAESLGELDFGRLCRQRGWPEPSRQLVARGPNGRVFLDVCWQRYGVVVEIDGVGHLRTDQWVADALRQNAVTLDRGRVLRVPVLALRVRPEPFLDQVEAALIAGGWHRPP